MSALEYSVGGNHYEENPIQPIEFILANNLNWCEANAIKYICRHRAKNGRQDLEKAVHYLQILIEREYPEAEEEPRDQTIVLGPDVNYILAPTGEFLCLRHPDGAGVSVSPPEDIRPFEGFFWGVSEDCDGTIR